MAIDASRLKRRLPEPPPPTEGAAGIEQESPPPVPASDPSAPLPAAVAAAPTAPAEAHRLDGRALRATGRVHQLNVKVSAQTKSTVLRLASERRLLVAEVIEEAIRLLERTGR
jgi:hypothetical protein